MGVIQSRLSHKAAVEVILTRVEQLIATFASFVPNWKREKNYTKSARFN